MSELRSKQIMTALRLRACTAVPRGTLRAGAAGADGSRVVVVYRQDKTSTSCYYFLYGTATRLGSIFGQKEAPAPPPASHSRCGRSSFATAKAAAPPSSPPSSSRQRCGVTLRLSVLTAAASASGCAERRGKTSGPGRTQILSEHGGSSGLSRRNCQVPRCRRRLVCDPVPW